MNLTSITTCLVRSQIVGIIQSEVHCKYYIGNKYGYITLQEMETEIYVNSNIQSLRATSVLHEVKINKVHNFYKA